MLAVRSTIDRARVLQRVGVPLSEPCDLPDAARRCTRPHGLRGWANAVAVYGFGSEPDLSAIAPGLPPGPAQLIVMEELTGGTLEVPPAVPRSINELTTISAGLAGGLALLAAAHVVHADLKVRQHMFDGCPSSFTRALKFTSSMPTIHCHALALQPGCLLIPYPSLQGANIMRRTRGGEVVLTDYGVGRIANAGVDVATYAGTAAGTMLYLSPELMRGERRANTFASDVCVSVLGPH